MALPYRGSNELEPDLAHLFISNHRDITLDSGFMNLALFRAGHPTTRMAIGDNLLRTGYAARRDAAEQRFRRPPRQKRRKAMRSRRCR